MNTTTWDGTERRGRRTFGSKMSHFFGHKLILEITRGIIIAVGAAAIYWGVGQVKAYVPDPDAQKRIPTDIWVDHVNAHIADQRQEQAQDKVEKETIRQSIARLADGQIDMKLEQTGMRKDISWLVDAEKARQLGRKAPERKP